MELISAGIGYVFGKIWTRIRKIFKSKKKSAIRVEKPDAGRDNNTAGRDVITGDTHNHYYDPNLSQINPPVRQKNPNYNLKYRNNDLLGKIKNFDYSNNNGKYVLGIDEMEFEVKFVGSCSEDIQVITDPPSIESLAISKSNVSWKNLHTATDIFSGDDSSRIRRPKVNQIVVWKNTNGYYMLMKILDIKHEYHGDDKDDVSFQYCIGRKIDGKFSPMINEYGNGFEHAHFTPKIGMTLWWRNIKDRPPAEYKDVKGSSYPGHKFQQNDPNFGINDVIIDRDLVLCEGTENA